MVRMMRRFTVLLLLLLVIAMPAMAQRVFDECNLFTDSEVQKMEDLISTIQKNYQMDVVVLTSKATPYDPSESCSKIQKWANDYYDSHDFGIGKDRAGLLYLIDMNNRVPIISTTGVMIDYMTDHRLDELFDASQSALANGQYGTAALTVLRRASTMLKQGREAGSFRYDAETGERLTGLYNPLTQTEILMAVGAGILVALIVFASVNGSYNLKMSTYRYDCGRNASRELTVDEQVFIGQSVHRIPRVQSNGGGGGGRGGFGGGMGSSVSGGHGGGHGGRF